MFELALKVGKKSHGAIAKKLPVQPFLKSRFIFGKEGFPTQHQATLLKTDY